MNFQIVQQVTGKEFVPAMRVKTKTPMIYDCPKKAKRVADRLTALKGIKFQLRPIADNDWRQREQQRFDNGNYKPVLWVGQDWWENNKKPDHFTHIAVKDQTRIAFIRDDKCGLADIQTAMKPGKYLAEFFGDVLSADQIRTFAMQHTMKFENTELKFAWTPEEIQRVYEPSLGSSCFSGTTKANLYGSGDFAVAYIEDNGKITARSVTCPARKIYIHPYGDTVRIKTRLHDLGFKNNATAAAWAGLRLVTKWYWPGFYTDWSICPEPTDKTQEFFTI